MDSPSNWGTLGGKGLDNIIKVELMMRHLKSQKDGVEGSIKSINALMDSLQGPIESIIALIANQDAREKALENTKIDIFSSWASPGGERLHEIGEIAREIKRMMRHLKSQMDGLLWSIVESINAPIARGARQEAIENTKINIPSSCDSPGELHEIREMMREIKWMVPHLESRLDVLEGLAESINARISNGDARQEALENKVQNQGEQITELTSYSEMHFNITSGISKDAQSCKILLSRL